MKMMKLSVTVLKHGCEEKREFERVFAFRFGSMLKIRILNNLGGISNVEIPAINVMEFTATCDDGFTVSGELANFNTYEISNVTWMEWDWWYTRDRFTHPECSFRSTITGELQKISKVIILEVKEQE